MEAVGLASGIAGLMTLAIQLGGALHEYANAIKNKDRTIEDLANEISTLGSALSEFNKTLHSAEQKSLKFEEDCVLSRAYIDCKQRIERIGQVIWETQNGSRSRRMWQTVKWPFKQKEVVQMIENLRRFTQVFNFAVNIRNCTILAQTSARASEQLTRLQVETQQASEHLKELPQMLQTLQEDTLKRHSTQLQAIQDLLPTLSQQADQIQAMQTSLQFAEEREQRRLKNEILNWLVPNAGLPKHPELQRKRGDNTCQWFIEHEDFQNWAHGSSENNNFLCVGGPGTGKTILCSIVIDHLQILHADSNSAVLHYYCDFFEKSSRTSSHFARSLLRQLVQASKGIPVAVLEFYRTTLHNMQDIMWLQQLHAVLVKIIVTFDKCFLVLDALDETDLKEQRKGMFEILNIVRGTKGHFRTLATSRPHISDIEQQFPDNRPFEVGASSVDIHNFLKMKLDESPVSSEILDESLRSEILTSLCEVAQGMFLLPALQIDQILNEVTTGGARRALRNLSRTLPEVFATTMHRISELPPAKKDLAMKTLLWISHAERPLTVAELQHALAVHIEEQEFDYDDIPAVNTIKESCCGLVELVGDDRDINTQYIIFVHFSLQEFLLGQKDLFIGADLFITKTCLRYLTLKSLQFIAQGNRKALMRTLVHYPFLEYASLFWGYHAMNLAVELYQESASSLFNDRDALFLALRVRDAGAPNDSEWETTTTQIIDSGSGGISIAASFGLAALVQLLIDRGTGYDLNVKNIHGGTPLHECAINGSIETANVLIANGADVLSINKGGATPFYLAVAFDRIELCRLLLQAGIDQVNKAKNDGYTPLHKACEFGTHEMVTLLVVAGAKVNVANDAQRCGKMTPLHLACSRGNLPAVHLLVHSGAELETRNRDGCTALDLAATHGELSIAQYLIENGASLTGKSRGGWTPLHQAARAGQVEVARLLLERGANLLERDYRRCLPFTLAVKRGDTACVNLLLEYNPSFTLHQLENLDIDHESAKIKAYSNAHYELYKYLRDLEVRLKHNEDNVRPAATDDPIIALTHAIEGGSLADVTSLLNTNPKLLRMRDSLGQMPIHTAFIEQKWEIALELLERGTPIDSRGYHNWTPLIIAAAAGSYRMLTLALQYNANVHAVSHSSNNALQKAGSAASFEVFLELLQCGSDPYAQNDYLMTALHIAANHNFVEAARELLNPKWYSQAQEAAPLIFIRDKRGNIARWWAERSGHLALADYLRLEERRVKSGGSLNLSEARPRTSRRSTPLQSRFPRSPLSGTASPTSLSRTTTRDSLVSQTTNTTYTALLSPPIDFSKSGRFSRQSTDSVFSISDDGDPSGDIPRTPGTPDTSKTADRAFESPFRDQSAHRIERRFAEMLLELDDDASR